MKTVLTQNVDGFEIVKGFDKPVLDPETTKDKAKKQLLEDENFKALLESYRIKLQKKTDDYLVYWKKCKADPSFRTQASYELFLASQAEIQLEIVNLANQIKEARDIAFNDNRTYFEPKKGETIIDDKKYSSLINAIKKLKPHHLLDVDGNSVANYKGRKYHENINGEWYEKEITKLGEQKPDNSIWNNEASEAQKVDFLDSKERKRIASLTTEEKQTEFDDRKKYLLSKAALQMNELELIDDPDPKGKSKAWLDEQTQELKNRYGIG